MKKLALALVCLVSVAFFASCDPQEIVQELQPSIEVLTGEDYLQNGDVIDMYELRDYGFRCASNPTSQAELAKFVLTSTITTGEDDEVPSISVICDSVISGTEFTYLGELYFEWEEKEIVASAEITATVTDVDGFTNQISFKIDINESEDLVTLPFQWTREGSNDGEGLAIFGLKWTRNLDGKETFAVIEPLDNTVAMYSVPAEKWDEVQTITDKAALFSDGGAAEPIRDYRGVSAWASHEYNDVIATCYDGFYYLIHITKGTVTTKGTNIVIDGEVK